MHHHRRSCETSSLAVDSRCTGICAVLIVLCVCVISKVFFFFFFRPNNCFYIATLQLYIACFFFSLLSILSFLSFFLFLFFTSDRW